MNAPLEGQLKEDARSKLIVQTPSRELRDEVESRLIKYFNLEPIWAQITNFDVIPIGPRTYVDSKDGVEGYVFLSYENEVERSHFRNLTISEMSVLKWERKKITKEIYDYANNLNCISWRKA